jgi:hypothetical protein
MAHRGCVELHHLRIVHLDKALKAHLVYTLQVGWLAAYYEHAPAITDESIRLLPEMQ